MPDERTRVLVIGAGPVGLSTALFLARQGVTPILVERRPTISRIPRATGLHSRTMELFRMAGMEPDIRRHGLKIVNVGMEDDEVDAGRATPLAMYLTPSLAALDERSPLVEEHHVPYDDFTPCWPLWCGQDHYEPVLLGNAVRSGVDVRFNTEMLSVDQDAHGVTVLVERRDTGERYAIRADYVVGADGARSPTRRQIGIDCASNGVADHFVSIIFRADVDRGDKPRFTFLALIHPEVQGLLLVIERGRWMLGAIYHPERGEQPADFTEQRCVELVRLAVGDPDLDVTVESVSPWEARHMIADYYRNGRVFLAGDACHAHPPAGGYGVNAGIQDAHDLAWKLAAVVDGWAGPALLDTYAAERRPVGAATAEQAWLLFATRGGRLTPEQAAALRDFIVVTTGYRYRSAAVIGADPDGDVLPRTLEFTGAPGTRAPHGWVLRSGRRMSMLDLFGDAFVLVGGEHGVEWTEAAARVAKALEIPLRCHRFGPSGALVGEGGDWTATAGIGAGGAILVRPDGFVAWRATEQPDTDVDEVLTDVFRSLLGRAATTPAA